MTEHVFAEEVAAGASAVGARRFDARRWFLIFLALNGIGAFFIAQAMITRGSRGYPPSLTVAVLSELTYWWVWFPMLPVVFLVAQRFPFEPGNRWRATAVHVVLGAVCATLHTIVYLPIMFRLEPLPPGAPMPALRYVFFALTAFWKYFVFIGIYYAFLYYKRSRESQLRAAQLESSLAQARLGALRSQLHPHFLFNTLHAVSMLNFTDVDAANRILTRLGDLLRLTLARSNEQEITLARELEMLRPYCDIEQTRFQDRMQIHFDVANDALSTLVPTLVLQPLVENAIRHGIAKMPEGGTIEIGAANNGSALRLWIQDDGPGLPADWDPDSDQRVGLSNTRARLKELYGDQQTFVLKNRAEGGLRIDISIPARHE